ncbi:hypothetical protein BJ878DRAFT_283938 [Calycina marina]|uniref:Uncharacterized protein n=1 Tax=Calycina marina TaxID=1763456 RepID=A0A9P7YVN3_9HELO|nr:hypothetical protein BJ878DRAFT_283938 [Calycina marina]
MAFSFPQAVPSSQSQNRQYGAYTEHGTSHAGSSSSGSYAQYSQPQQSQQPPQPTQFDIENFRSKYQSCQRHFIDIAQHNNGVQALAVFMNIRLPYQKQPTLASPSSHNNENIMDGGVNRDPAQNISLVPYIRRLIVTGHDEEVILHGFFGQYWRAGIGSLHEIERRNYLFAAKSQSWLKVKQHYDMSEEETCPFILPLRRTTELELQAADSAWSEWLAMGDWMLGPRSPDALNQPSRTPQMKCEPQD